MRSIYWIIPLSMFFFVCSCNSYKQIGSVTIISTRTYNLDDNYQLKKSNAEKKVTKNKADKNDVDMINYAIDELLKNNEGEFLKNARIYISKNFKKMKIEGDVWGY